MPVHLRTALALVLGLGLGLLGGADGFGWARFVSTTALEPVGRVFLRLVEMGVIPLVATTVVLSVVRTGDLARLGRLGGRCVLFFGTTLLLAAAIGVAAGVFLLPLVPVSPEAASRMREVAGEAPAASQPAPGFAEFLVGLIPKNPVEAAAGGSLLPLVVFCVLLGAGLAKVDPDRREPFVRLLDAIAGAMGKIFGWVLALAPVGVFALAASAAAKIGGEILAQLAWFIAVVLFGLGAFLGLGLATAVRFVAGIDLRKFGRAALPAQAVAFSTTSSIASLPALFEASEKGLALRPGVSGLVLPLAASVYRPGSAVFQAVAALLVARLFGVVVPIETCLLLVPVTALASLSVPSVPFGSFVAMTPVFAAAGAPLAGFGLLLAVDRIPDMCRTAVNATGHLVAAAAVAKSEEERER